MLRKWAPILEAGKRIRSQETACVLAQCLENTTKELVRQGILKEDVRGTEVATAAGKINPFDRGEGKGGILKPTDPNGVGNGDNYLPTTVIPMLRRIFPDLIANELVAVQAMTGPLGYAFAFRAGYYTTGNPAYADNYNTNTGKLGYDYKSGIASDREIGFDAPETRWTGVESKNKVDGEFWAAYAGANSDAFNGVGRATEYQSEWARLSDGTYPQANFQLIHTPVEAKSRKLAATWSYEKAEDLEAMHGLNVESEMTDILSYELGAAIDRQIVTEMVKAAILGKATATWSPDKADGIDQMGRLATLLTQITIEAEMIAIRSRRGHANFVIASPRVCALLQQLGMNKFVNFDGSKNVPTLPAAGIGALQKVGLINDGQQLLVRDSYRAPGGDEYVLMGYKGTKAGDSGLIYCPYIPISIVKIPDSDSFNPQIGARTRYGLLNNPWDARNYYTFIKVSGISDLEYNFSEPHRTFTAPVANVPRQGTAGAPEPFVPGI